jgi:hypothetical protein
MSVENLRVSRRAPPEDFNLLASAIFREMLVSFLRKTYELLHSYASIRSDCTNKRATRRETLPQWHTHASSSAHVRVVLKVGWLIKGN